MGPQSARSYPGRRVVKPASPKAQRAKQEIDYGRRGKGYVFGAFRPATGEAFTETYAGRTTANWVDFLGRVEGWIDAGSSGSTRWWTTSTSTAPPMCSCSRSPTRAGSSYSSPNTRPTLT